MYPEFWEVDVRDLLGLVVFFVVFCGVFKAGRVWKLWIRAPNTGPKYDIVVMSFLNLPQNKWYRFMTIMSLYVWTRALAVQVHANYSQT